jgi:hypothetical protein
MERRQHSLLGHEMPGRQLLFFSLSDETAQEAAPRRRLFLLRDRHPSRRRAVLIGVSVIRRLRVSLGTGLPRNRDLNFVFCHDLLNQHSNGGRRIGRVEKDQHLAGQRLGRDGGDSSLLCESCFEEALERLRMIQALDLIPHPSRDGGVYYLNHSTSSLYLSIGRKEEARE